MIKYKDLILPLSNFLLVILLSSSIVTCGFRGCSRVQDKGTNLPPSPQINPDDIVEQLASKVGPEAGNIIRQFEAIATPTLVFGCKIKRVGSLAIAEEKGNLPNGTEYQALINLLCNLTEMDKFCSKYKKIQVPNANDTVDDLIEWEFLNESGMCVDDDGRIIVYQIVSPTCPFCNAQERYIDMLKKEFNDTLVVYKVCLPVHGEHDVELCRNETYGFDYK